MIKWIQSTEIADFNYGKLFLIPKKNPLMHTVKHNLRRMLCLWQADRHIDGSRIQIYKKTGQFCADCEYSESNQTSIWLGSN